MDKVQITPRIKTWLFSLGFFTWGTDDAWIHEDDEGTVMNAIDAIDLALEREREAGETKGVTAQEEQSLLNLVTRADDGEYPPREEDWEAITAEARRLQEARNDDD